MLESDRREVLGKEKLNPVAKITDLIRLLDVKYKRESIIKELGDLQLGMYAKLEEGMPR